MKLKFSALLFAIAIIFPNIALAAWWNPLSWFEEQKTATIVSEPVKPSAAEIKDTNNTKVVEPVEQTQQNVPPKMPTDSIPKIESSASGQNYNNEISELRQEIATLKNSLASVQKSYNDVLVSLGSQLNNKTVAFSNSTELAYSLEKRVDKLSTTLGGIDVNKINTRLSNLEDHSQAKDFTPQIKEMAKRINALLHANTNGSGLIYCGYLESSLREGNPGSPCSSFFSDLNY